MSVVTATIAMHDTYGFADDAVLYRGANNVAYVAAHWHPWERPFVDTFANLPATEVTVVYVGDATTV